MRVPGQEKTDSQFVWFCLILEPGFLLVSGAGLIFEVQNSAAEQNVDTSRFGTGKPSPCNHHIYHSHVLELLTLEFLNFFGGWRGWG